MLLAYNLREIEDLHERCCDIFHPLRHRWDAVGNEQKPPTLQLNFLYTCRQIYQEAQEVLYAKFIWSFSMPHDIESFMDVVPKSCDIRSIRLEIALGGYGSWTGDLAEVMDKVAKHMKSLREVYIKISDYQGEGCLYLGLDDHLPKVQAACAPLGKLSLQVVTVIIMDERCKCVVHENVVDNWIELRRLHVAQKQAFSKTLRKTLLGHECKWA